VTGRSGLALVCLGATTLLNGGIGRAALPTAPAAPLRASAFPEVIPRPGEVDRRAGGFVVGASTPILIGQDAEVRRIASYFADLLHTSRALSLAVSEQKSTPTHGRAIAFRLDPTASAAPESYHIEVSPREIVVSAREPRGLFYGAVTLWQLCTAASGAGAIRIPAMQIKDAPRLRWRGLMLDSARHFQSPEFILHYLDWMALHKLNVLSWHLTDDQGWRLEIKRYPRLTDVGAWRVPAGRAAQHDIDPATGRPRLYGGFYTQQDVRRIVAYAAARNVTIVPEIDVPGHSTAAIVAYPQLGMLTSAPGAVPADWGIYPNLLNVEESTFTFLENVLDEVMALFPGRDINLGGDEAVKDQWQASARVQARIRELHVQDEAALQGYFTARLGRYLQVHGRRLVGWDEILEGGLPPEAIVMSWRGVKGALSAAAAGHDVVLAPDPTLYFDNRQGSSASEPPGRGRLVGLEEVYRFDPLPGSLAGDSGRVLGVQGNLWTEHVRTEERAAYMSYPRAAALAEVAWSQPARLDWNDFLRRLAPQFARYRALGIPHAEDAFAVPHAPAAGERHMSQDLKTCTGKLVLSLEDDAPVDGPRAVFLIDIMNPCWIFPDVDLSAGAQLRVAVGQAPFNFQLGKDVEAIKLRPPATPAGELEVRVNGCDGVSVAVLPLAAAVDNDAVTQLPSVRLASLAGHHDLCFTFTQAQLDPLWAIDWVQVSP
jgi:hexosaminidase